MKLKKILPLLVILMGVGSFLYFKNTRPKPKKRDYKSSLPLVEIKSLKKTNKEVVLRAHGTVLAQSPLRINSEINARVTFIHSKLRPGGFINKGEVLAELDNREAKLEIISMEATVKRAESELLKIKGKGAVAKKEWKYWKKIRPKKKISSLALYKPQILVAKAELDSAKAKLKRSLIRLAKHKIIAPFDLVVIKRSIEIGQLASPSSALAQVASSNKVEIEAKLSVKSLKWIRFDKDKASKVKVYTPDGQSIFWGQVKRLLPDLEKRGKMARVTVEVSDPFLLNSAKSQKENTSLLHGSFVNMEIYGKELKNLYSIPRKFMGAEGKLLFFENGSLKIIQKKPFYISEDIAYFRDLGLEKPKLITNNLKVSYEGMKIRIKGEKTLKAKTVKRSANAQ